MDRIQRLQSHRSGDDEMLREMRDLRRELKRQRRALEDKDRELKTYLHTLSHEIRSPIVSIRGYTNLLLDELRDALPQEGKHYIQRVTRNIDQLETLIDDLVLLSGFNTDDMIFESINVNELIDDILFEVRQNSDLEYDPFHVQPEMPRVHAYREGIYHVFQNLIVNALKYSRPKARAKIEIGCLDDEIFLKFFVRDNGVGVPVKYRRKIFEMFARAGNKRNAKGSGLGLSITRQIIAAHGGEIWVHSTVGKGSTFFFTMPAAHAQGFQMGKSAQQSERNLEI